MGGPKREEKGAKRIEDGKGGRAVSGAEPEGKKKGRSINGGEEGWGGKKKLKKEDWDVEESMWTEIAQGAQEGGCQKRGGKIKGSSVTRGVTEAGVKNSVRNSKRTTSGGRA